MENRKNMKLTNWNMENLNTRNFLRFPISFLLFSNFGFWILLSSILSSHLPFRWKFNLLFFWISILQFSNFTKLFLHLSFSDFAFFQFSDSPFLQVFQFLIFTFFLFKNFNFKIFFDSSSSFSASFSFHTMFPCLRLRFFNANSGSFH